MSDSQGGESKRPFREGETCPVCGEGQLRLHDSPFKFTYKGQRKTFPMQRFVCDACKEDFVDDQAAAAIEPELRRWRREVDGLLQPEEIREIRRKVGVSQRQMAAVIGGGSKSFAKYETGVVTQSQAIDNVLRMIDRHPQRFTRLAYQRGIDITIESTELLLVWKNPDTRLRYVIGVLRRDRHGYHFRYETQVPKSLEHARAVGFSLLDDFPKAEREYHADDLFPVFHRRLPADDAVYDDLDLTPDQDMEYLRLTGGRLANDTLEFLEPIDEREDGCEYSVTFPVAGWRYSEGESVINELQEKTELRLELEPENKHDPHAVLILTQSGRKLGYVPAVYAWYIDDAVEAGACRAVVQRIGPKEDPQSRVMVHLTARVLTGRPVRGIPQLVKRFVELVPLER